jgi:acyl-CoA synthetase (AMP-forming)/AMP-acid ligase II
MPEKTAERFVPNPFSDDPTYQTLYRTGALGHLISNNTNTNNGPEEQQPQKQQQQSEISGRCDFMVKIRGYSVVLGAIETALAKHPKLSSSVVLAVGSEGGREGKKLAAYVIPTNGAILLRPPVSATF